MKITIYELLGLMKDGKAPINIEFNLEKYYMNCEGEYIRFDTYSNLIYLSKEYKLLNCLNDEVVIIEEVEDKDITEVLEIELLGQCDNWLQSKTVNKKIDMELNPYILEAITRNFKLLYSKQCEIVDVVNKLKNDNRKEVRLVEAKEYEDIEEIGNLKYCENEVESILHRKIDALIRNQKYILNQLNNGVNNND